MFSEKKVTYGPHQFPRSPLRFIKSHMFDVCMDHHHIKNTLTDAFSDDDFRSQLSLDSQPVNLSFINYGNTELVYLATSEDKKMAVLINQPHMPKGVVRDEFRNLNKVYNHDPTRAVEPYAFFSNGTHELYACEYFDKAMCIYNGNDRPWGVFDPVPTYHYESFSSPEVAHAIVSCMIGLLVHYHHDGKGLAKTQIAGDDFILTRDFDKKDPATVLPNMKLISARAFIDCSLDEYVDIIREEFRQATTYDDWKVRQGKIKVNCKSRIPLSEQEIEEGIELGMDLRKSKP